MIQQQSQWGHRIATWAATGFGVGRAPFAPGTWGTLLALPLYLLLRDVSIAMYAVVVLTLFVVGAWICGVAERRLGRHDHGAIVWDEVVGYLITLWQAPRGWFWVVAGFVLFRLFDIWKPFPLARLERLPGGLGVMADDAGAGIYAFAVMQLTVVVSAHTAG